MAHRAFRYTSPTAAIAAAGCRLQLQVLNCLRSVLVLHSKQHSSTAAAAAAPGWLHTVERLQQLQQLLSGSCLRAANHGQYQ